MGTVLHRLLTRLLHVLLVASVLMNISVLPSATTPGNINKMSVVEYNRDIL